MLNEPKADSGHHTNTQRGGARCACAYNSTDAAAVIGSFVFPFVGGLASVRERGLQLQRDVEWADLDEEEIVKREKARIRSRTSD